MVDKILNECLEQNMLRPGMTVMACVSGGADSMCLLDVLLRLSGRVGFAVCAAHYNHNLRGEESDGDEAFVRDWCQKLGVPLYAGSGDVAGEAARRGRGLEETARDMRYAFFFQTAGERGIQRVATGHNADDNLETVLMRIARGTGLRGLGGIPPARGRLIRPLLPFTRDEIEAYDREAHIPFRVDSSNLSDDYARNLLRHKAAPVLRELNPALNVSAMTGLLRRDEEYLTGQAQAFLDTQPQGELDAGALAALPFPVSSRAVRLFCGRELSLEHVEAVLALASRDDPSAKLHLPGITLRREYGRILLGDVRPVTFSARPVALDRPVIIDEPGLAVFAENTVFDGEIYKSLTTFPINRDKIVGRLMIRPRKPGDRLRLSPASGSRSVKKLLIDKKIPRHLRDALPVIADDHGAVAVYGLGMDTDYLPDKGKPAIIIIIKEREKHA